MPSTSSAYRGKLFPPSEQRPALLALAIRLDSRSSALRRDECGDWRIAGQRGHVYADGNNDSFVVVVSTTSARSWNVAKTALAPFATLTQDGDEEGAFRLDRLPTSDEGTTLRRTLRIAKRRHVSDEEREVLATRLRAMAANRV